MKRSISGQSKPVLVVATIVALIVGAVGGFFVGGAGAGVVTVTSTIERIKTITETVAADGAVITMTVTQTLTTTLVSTVTQAPAVEVESGRLLLFTWEEEATDAFLNPFREKYPQVQLETAIYGDQDEMVAKLQAGFRADVIAPCSDYIGILLDLGLIQPIDVRLLDNWLDMFPELWAAPGVVVDGEVYFIPTNIGQEGIMYRTDKIQREITSWNDLWDPEFAGHILMPDDPKISIAIAALALGFKDPWNLNEEQLQQVKEKLIEQKPLVLKYSDEPDVEAAELMAAGDVWISVGWIPEVNELTSEGIPVKYVSPKEGEFIFMCGNSIVKGTQMPVAAHKLVDNFLAPHVQTAFADPEEFGYWVTNKRVVEEMIDPEVVEAAGLDKVLEVLQNAVFEEAVPNYDLWISVWEEVLAA
ncbi:MAG TPA: extracellular solute-binding protein [Candidatus Caldiarchaeum subterraneum]|uniref:Extracellular solute-binding protein n=1 Tax=Caldiarchaeum subterraneum TaxID=311458 RepID=A0A832ZWF4_CALS0|nr:extracellular solute-binding protein [Aigarchaeota archaeon]HIQ29706.1 extracellular solute-binding protein [Candidatus Caldarchaeum subterraneum]